MITLDQLAYIIVKQHMAEEISGFSVMEKLYLDAIDHDRDPEIKEDTKGRRDAVLDPYKTGAYPILNKLSDMLIKGIENTPIAARIDCLHENRLPQDIKKEALYAKSQAITQNIGTLIKTRLKKLQNTYSTPEKEVGDSGTEGILGEILKDLETPLQISLITRKEATLLLVRAQGSFPSPSPHKPHAQNHNGNFIQVS